MTSLHWNGPKSAHWILVLAHGAGADMESPFMQSLAESLGQHGIRVGRFNFPYMIRAIEEGKRRPPDSAKKLLAAWEDVIVRMESYSFYWITMATVSHQQFTCFHVK